jgi:hypothetical protein
MPMRCLLSMSAAIAILALAGCTGDPGPPGSHRPCGTIYALCGRAHSPLGLLDI